MGTDSRVVRGDYYKHVVPTFAWYRCSDCGRWNQCGSHDHAAAPPRACEVTRGCPGTMMHTLSSPPRPQARHDEIWSAVKAQHPGASEKAASYRAWAARLLGEARLYR